MASGRFATTAKRRRRRADLRRVEQRTIHPPAARLLAGEQRFQHAIHFGGGSRLFALRRP